MAHRHGKSWNKTTSFISYLIEFGLRNAIAFLVGCTKKSVLRAADFFSFEGLHHVKQETVTTRMAGSDCTLFVPQVTTPMTPIKNVPGTPKQPMFEWLFQLDGSKPLLGNWQIFTIPIILKWITSGTR